MLGHTNSKRSPSSAEGSAAHLQPIWPMKRACWQALDVAQRNVVADGRHHENCEILDPAPPCPHLVFHSRLCSPISSHRRDLLIGSPCPHGRHMRSPPCPCSLKRKRRAVLTHEFMSIPTEAHLLGSIISPASISTNGSLSQPKPQLLMYRCRRMLWM